jgi:putative SOS response-associated peptidase YedK
MCGRFQQTTPPEEVAERFGASAGSAAALRAAGWRPRWNVSPGTDVVALRADEPGGRALVRLRWGLVPRWAKDAKIGQRLVNARAETAAEKPAFRDALKRRRCLLPADGFYEWTSTGGPRLPWRARLEDGLPFALAGLWERWRDPADAEAPALETCTILTTEANARVAPVHTRMPVVVAPADWPIWLAPGAPEPGALGRILAPGDRTALVLVRVSDHVNDPRHEGASCALPLDEF